MATAVQSFTCQGSIILTLVCPFDRPTVLGPVWWERKVGQLFHFVTVSHIKMVVLLFPNHTRQHHPNTGCFVPSVFSSKMQCFLKAPTRLTTALRTSRFLQLTHGVRTAFVQLALGWRLTMCNRAPKPRGPCVPKQLCLTKQP